MCSLTLKRNIVWPFEDRDPFYSNALWHFTPICGDLPKHNFYPWTHSVVMCFVIKISKPRNIQILCCFVLFYCLFCLIWSHLEAFYRRSPGCLKGFRHRNMSVCVCVLFSHFLQDTNRQPLELSAHTWRIVTCWGGWRERGGTRRCSSRRRHVMTESLLSSVAHIRSSITWHINVNLIKQHHVVMEISSLTDHHMSSV